MKRSLREYTLNSELDFGFFEGCTVAKVYSGAASSNPTLLKTGLSWEFEHIGLNNLGGLLKVVRINGRLAFTFKEINIDGRLLKQLAIPDIELDSKTFWYLYCVENKYAVQDEEIYPFVLTLGHPDYLSWAIKTVDWFCLSESAITSFQSNKFISKVIFSSHQINGVMYSIPSFEQSSFAFSPDVLQINQAKQSRLTVLK